MLAGRNSELQATVQIKIIVSQTVPLTLIIKHSESI